MIKNVDLLLLSSRARMPKAQGGVRSPVASARGPVAVTPAKDARFPRATVIPPAASHRAVLRARYAEKFGLRLDYAPINTEVYVNAFDGAMWGMLGRRFLISTSPSSYTEQTLAAGVWAQEVDVLWASATAIDEVQAEGLLLGSFGAWLGRNAGASLTQEQVTNLAASVIASVTEAVTFFGDQGISPPSWNQG
jgi:hypothetical protein